MEILSPAGDFEALKAAVSAGADAVYLGGCMFSARSSAVNFSNEELLSAVDYCHLHKVKVYSAVNTLISDREMKIAEDYIRYLNEIGIDGIIVQDLGLIETIKAIAPSLPLHASTQMTVIDSYGASFLKDAGFCRVVVARELSKEQIFDIKKKAKIEVEAFVHGAICVCYSGQCLMSSFIGGRSGNRGKCAQPCRLIYKMDKKSGYLLSPKDMSLIEHMNELKSIKVDSLKIEGRMKSAEYVGTVTSIYRKYADKNEKVSKDDLEKLYNIFNRGGYTDRYFTGKKSSDMICHKKPDNPYLMQKKAQIPTYERKRKINIYFTLYLNEPILLKITDETGVYAEYKGEVLSETAQKMPLSEERVVSQLSKLGGTVFEVENINIRINGNITIPISEINKARRDCISNLEKNIALHYRRHDSKKYNFVITENKVQDFVLSVRVSNKEQLHAIRKTDCKKIYAPLGLAREDEIAVLPRITSKNIFDNLKNIKFALAENIGQVKILNDCNIPYYADFTLNSFNSRSVEFLRNANANGVILSCELMLAQIREIKSEIPLGAVIYGRIPLMITENCLINSSIGCANGKGNVLIDRVGERFPIRCTENCQSEILNSKPIVMSDKMSEVKSCLSEGVLLFTTETPEECVKIYNAYKNGEMINTDFTRGKFYKGV